MGPDAPLMCMMLIPVKLFTIFDVIGYLSFVESNNDKNFGSCCLFSFFYFPTELLL